MSSKNRPWKINMEANNGGFFWFQPLIFQGVGFGLEIPKREIVTSPTLAKLSISGFPISCPQLGSTPLCVYIDTYTLKVKDHKHDISLDLLIIQFS